MLLRNVVQSANEQRTQLERISPLVVTLLRRRTRCTMDLHPRDR